MIKLYKRLSAGTLLYHEAWIDGGKIIEHWGRVGTRGETRIHEMKSQSKSRELERILQSTRQEGFAEIDLDEHRRLLVEYAIQDMGSAADLDKRHRLEERLNQMLGWTGLGMCDGGSIGSGNMEVCCFVVDFALAKSVIDQIFRGQNLPIFLESMTRTLLEICLMLEHSLEFCRDVRYLTIRPDA